MTTRYVLRLLLCLLVPGLSVHAQIRISDIRPGVGASTPELLTNSNGILYFVADDGTHGRELWKSDGTEQGTMLVKDIIPGVVNGNVQNLTNVNGTVFFSATNPTVVNQFGGATKLWKSTGTDATTVELYDGIENPLESINPVNLTNVGGTLYYTNSLALGGSSNSGLLKSNETNSPGTQILEQLPVVSPKFSRPSQLTDVSGTLYFMYDGGLWKSTGGPAVLVKTISPGPEDTKIQGLINVGGTLFFSANDGSSGNVRRLWKSDGTTAGTVKLKDGITNPAEGPNPDHLTDVNGTLYYTSLIAKGGSSFWGLFKSDGTDNPGTKFFGTFVVSMNDTPLGGTDIPYDSKPIGAAAPYNLINVDGTLYFVFANSLWKSNGTAASTTRVANAVSPSYLTNVGGTLYFVSGTGSIYKTDPSVSTASSVVVSPDPTFNLTNVNGTLFYTHSDPATGTELYKIGSAPPVGGTLQLTAPAYNCQSGAFTFQTSGGNGALIEYRAIGITGWTANPNQFVDTELRTAADAKPITLYARQNGVEVTFSFDIRAQCPVGGSQPPVNSGLQLLAPAYNCQSGAFTFQTNGGNGAPIEYMAPGITGWTTNPNQFVDTELRTAADAKPITLYARQNGVTITFVFDIRATCPVGGNQPPVSGSLLTLTVPSYNCQSGAFTFQTSGGNGSLIEYMAPGITGWTTNPNQFVDTELRTAADAKPITLYARQNGIVVTFVFDIRAQCPVNAQARQAAVQSVLEVRLRAIAYPNPVAETFTVAIDGATGQTVRLWIVDVLGRTVLDQPVQVNQPHHRETVCLPRTQPGQYLLRVSTPTQARTVRLLVR